MYDAKLHTTLFMSTTDGTPAYLSIAEHLEHVCIKRFNGLVVAGEDLLLDGAQIQRVSHLLIVLAVPVGIQTQKD